MGIVLLLVGWSDIEPYELFCGGKDNGFFDFKSAQLMKPSYSHHYKAHRKSCSPPYRALVSCP